MGDKSEKHPYRYAFEWYVNEKDKQVEKAARNYTNKTCRRLKNETIMLAATSTIASLLSIIFLFAHTFRERFSEHLRDCS